MHSTCLLTSPMLVPPSHAGWTDTRQSHCAHRAARRAHQVRCIKDAPGGAAGGLRECLGELAHARVYQRCGYEQQDAPAPAGEVKHLYDDSSLTTPWLRPAAVT